MEQQLKISTPEKTPVAKKVCVVIPIYRTSLGEYEEISLRRMAKVLADRDACFVKPAGLDISVATDIFPSAVAEEFDPEYFRGISGYNRLMMSEEFYARFRGYDYILICQLDAYVFEDQLDHWCSLGYDYIGAPWLVRPVYNLLPLKIGSWIKHTVRRWAKMPDARRTWWKVGNGGLSLRRVSSHLKAVERLQDVIKEFLAHPGNHLFNEDVFFSTEVNRHGLDFKYPGWEEALGFAFDKYPKLCFELNGNKLPMGCHSWYKKRMRGFWFPIILKSN